ncbi:MAG: hypothetical protein H6597_04905 [Flavobacteriales bacterium]|nr:hypothetical protein [Flavobacteriales bacterium]MCB9193853.1 hypothetical protein [Flavobacteriales bacterium]
MIRALWSATMALLLLSACDKADLVPSRLHIATPTVSTDEGIQGSGSSNITEAWVYAENEAIGVWQFPSDVPVLRTGPTSIQLIAGVHRNGYRDDRVQYPFYKTWSGTVDLNEAGSTTLEPVFTYFDDLDFWIEGFEEAGYAFIPSGDTVLNTITDPMLVHEGNGTGEMYVDTGRTYLRITSADAFYPTPSTPVYLEIDYACDQQFLIGFLYSVGGTDQDLPYLYLNATGSGDDPPWKKCYVDLSGPMNIAGASDRRFYIQLQLASGNAHGRVLLDNIKLVSR